MTLSPLLLGPATTVHVGDALDVLASLPSTSVDAVVTDPPYALKRVPASRYTRPATRRPQCVIDQCSADRVCSECLRADAVAKFSAAPMLGQQSQNWHAQETHSRGYADNDPVQFQYWCALWLQECLRLLKPGGHLVAFGGTRTWHRLATAAEDTGFEIRDSLAWLYSSGMPKSQNVERALATAGQNASARNWSGWGTTLRPAFEPIVLARRPLEGTMANNVTSWNLGPINLAGVTEQPGDADAIPRWPSNVHMDDSSARALTHHTTQDPRRVFWVSKPNKHERVVVDGVAHPTVKPLDLLRRMVRLTVPKGGLVLDPFVGSGTTLEACLLEDVHAVGIERDPAYLPLIQKRVARQTRDEPPATSDDVIHLF
ncbi:DNA-methyltransferase [Nocardioides piscis]|uniref:Methyltransferase n=1 Tax=Nocardioides piscis TaxID=2714938 RepID=A0A6G7YD99_9ACTN|nr:site-specific DNA-methyltransferase [Nocardioides piscis]QIK74750.1 hypothetical protein G7071_04230 [Nocardioides piscis]